MTTLPREQEAAQLLDLLNVEPNLGAGAAYFIGRHGEFQSEVLAKPEG